MDDIPKLKRIFHKAFTLLASYQMKDCNCYKSIERSIPVRFANLNSWFKWNPYPYFPLQYTHTHTRASWQTVLPPIHWSIGEGGQQWFLPDRWLGSQVNR